MRFDIFTVEDRQKERELLASYDLDLKLFDQLGLKIKQIVPERNCFRIESDKGFYCLKKMDFSPKDLDFMQDITAHLRKNGFANTFEIVMLDNGQILHSYEGSQYYLTKWMDGRESSYLNLMDIKAAVEALAQFHIAARNFESQHGLKHRQIYGRWKEGFIEGLQEIQSTRERMLAEDGKNSNFKIAISYLNYCEDNANYALKLIEKPFYDKLNKRDMDSKGFIHHDYGLHNILHTFDNQTYIGGLESCAFDIRMHDLGHFVYRLMRRRGWNTDEAITIIEWYDEIYKLKKEDYEALAAYFYFPHDFRQFDLTIKETEDVEELDRINVESDYNVARKKFLMEFERYSEILL